MKIMNYLGLFVLLSGALSAQNFKSFNVTYKVKDKDFSNTVFIPEYDPKATLPIRGDIQKANGPLTEFAYKNHVAMFANLDDGRGFTKELLVAAAKASGRPEIEFAGAIVEGISKGGREAADWAAANQERAIAVILDHSAIWSMDFPKRVTGVPMFFNETYADLYQNIDRRKGHFDWCTAAFNAKQPCTAIVDHVKNGGHGGRGSTDLTAIWLEEAMNFRVPYIVPVGKPYSLINVDPTKCGGYVTAKISMDGTRSYHDNVKVTLKSAGANWWVPGPKSAAMYLSWVIKNGGTVEQDESAQIKNSPMFTNLNPEQTKILALIEKSAWSQASQLLDASKAVDDVIINIFREKVKNNVNSFLQSIDSTNATGDLYGVYLLLKNQGPSYKGIEAYEKLLATYTEKFQDKNNTALLTAGKEFYGTMEKINSSKKVTALNLSPLKNLAAKYPEIIYGKAAQKAFDKLTADLSLKLDPESLLK